MSYRRNWIAITVVILAWVVFIPVAQAQRHDAEFTEALLGKWSGGWEIAGWDVKGPDCLMVINKVDLDQKIIEMNYSWSHPRASGKADYKAEYIPPDKFKWRTKSSNLLEFQLKDGILWGRSTGGNYQGKIKMTKIKE
jgi:hypothetical protein